MKGLTLVAKRPTAWRDVTRETNQPLVDLPFISVALITFNEKKNIGNCLRSLYHIDYPRSRYEVVIVDGGSTDGTLDIMKQSPASIIIDARKNRGIARNTAVNSSKGEIIAFIDADCLATPSWLKEHVRVHQERSVLVAGGSVLHGGDQSLPTRIYHETYFAAQLPSASARTTWDLATCNASFKRAAFEDLGLFPEIDRGEDSLLCWRALRMGYKVVYDPSPKVIHIHERVSFRSLFERSRQQGSSDRQLQSAFGDLSPFRLPKRLVLTLFLAPSLLITRFLRYAYELLMAPDKKTVFSFPVVFASSLFWTLGYLNEARNLNATKESTARLRKS